MTFPRVGRNSRLRAEGVPILRRKPGRPRRLVPLAALVNVDNGASIHATAIKYGLPFSTLYADCARHFLKSAWKREKAISETLGAMLSGPAEARPESDQVPTEPAASPQSSRRAG